MSARFATTSCSQCGSEFGPGDHGFSSCKEHQPKASFTPGPWSLGESCDLLDRDGVIIESINETYDIRPAIGVKLGDELADMRLMAAAPDFLEACLELTKDWQRMSGTSHAHCGLLSPGMAKVYKAIEKAIGVPA